MNRIKFVLFLLCYSPAILLAQNIVDLLIKDKSKVSTQKWTDENGLPSNAISDLRFGSEGFLWIGTDVGLVRFDGYEMKNFNLLNTPEIKANMILNLFEDKKGTLWASNGTGGIIQYNKGKFRRFGIENGLPENNCSGIVEDENGKLWIGTRGGGLAVLDDSILLAVKLKNKLPSNRITAVANDKNGTIWIGMNDKGVAKKLGKEFVVYNELDGLPSKFVFDLFVDSLNRLWVIFFDGAVIIENGKIITPEYLKPFEHLAITSIAEDSRGRVCITTATTAYVLIENKFVEFYSVKQEKNILLQEILVRQNDVWFGTKGGGLLRLKENKIQNLTEKNGLLGGKVSALFLDSQKRFWIGNEKKILLFDLAANRILKTFDKPESDVLAFCELAPDKILIGTRTSGVWELNNSALKKIAAKRELGSNLIRNISKIDDKSAVIGTNGNGIAILSEGRFNILNKEEGLSSNLVSCMAVDLNGKLWMGTTGGGVNIYSNGKISSLINKSNGLAHNNVTSIIHDGSYTWVATNGGGLSRIREKQITNYTISCGLYESRIFNMLDDGNNRLWFTTRKGVFTISKQQLNDYADGKISKVNYQLFTKAEGMLSDECETLTMQTALILNNKFYAATMGGISIIDFANLKNVESAPKVFVDEIKVNNKLVPIDSTNSFEPGTENLEFHYSGISFDHGKNLSFYYKLEGLDEKWINVSSRRVAYFTHLPPGKYTIKIKAETPQGTQSITPASFTFYIQPFIYQRIWFQITVIMILFLIVAGLVRYISIRKLRARLEIIEAQAALERERIRISKDMHDELGAELTRIGLLSEIARNNLRTDFDKIDEDLYRITEASRDVAITMDEIVWAVNPKNDKIERMCGYTASYIQEYLSLTNIQLKIDFPEDLPNLYMSAEQRHNIFLVIKEAINNIVKHSKATEVKFETVYKQGVLEFKIIDNGIGVGSAIDEFSNGLINMRKRIDDIGGFFSIKNNYPGGTVVAISIDVN